MSKDYTNELINEWIETKQQIMLYEAKLDKLKTKIHKLMDNNDTNHLSSNKYVVYRKEMCRQTISKKCVPKSVWQEYAVTSAPYYQIYTKRK